MAAPTPHQLARSGTEDGHQAALFCALSKGIAEGYLDPNLKYVYAIPNGGSRGDSAKSRAIQGGKLKATGVKKGVPDIKAPIRSRGYPGLYIEMKRPKSERGRAGTTFNSQDEYHEFLRSQGYLVAVCVGWEAAYRLILEYMGVSADAITSQLQSMQQQNIA